MKGKTVFITGASSGIGRETAYRFAREGAKLVLTYHRHRAGGEETEARCRELGAVDTILLHLDVSSTGSIEEVVEQVEEQYGGVDVLVNNAGTSVPGPFAETTVEDIEKQVRTNFEGLMKLTLLMLPLVKETVINVASILGKKGLRNLAVYCGTKYGVRGFTQTLAMETPGLRICCVNPDGTATPMNNFGGRPPAQVAEVIFKAAAGELGCAGGGDVDVWEHVG